MDHNSKVLHKLVSLQRKIKIKFKRPKRFISALIHSSYKNENPHATQSDYERLEFFGDSILNFAICEKLYHLFPDANEGFLSRLRSVLVSKRILVRIARQLSLGKFIVVGKGERRQNFSHQIKLLADTLESLIGAIYLDRGLYTARAFVWRSWAPFLDEKKLSRLEPNPKGALQEFTQKTYHSLPKYTTQHHRRGFHSTVSITGGAHAQGIGSSKQEAETQAAQALLKKMKRGRRKTRPLSAR